MARDLLRQVMLNVDIRTLDLESAELVLHAQVFRLHLFGVLTLPLDTVPALVPLQHHICESNAHPTFFPVPFLALCQSRRPPDSLMH